MNRHKPPREALEAMWERAAPLSYRLALDRAGQTTQDQALTAVMALHEGVRGVLDRSLGVAGVDASNRVADTYSHFSQEVRALDLDSREERLVDEAVRRNMFTTYGNRFEAPALEHLQAMWGLAAVEDRRFHKRQAGEVAYGGRRVPWFVGGRVDALSPDGQTVIEVKNRVHHLFRAPPLYENVQLQAYMFVLDAPRGVLVECLRTQQGEGGGNGGGDGNEGEAGVRTDSSVSRVERDRALWERRVMPRLDAFVGFLAALLRDPALQDAYLALGPEGRDACARGNHFLL